MLVSCFNTNKTVYVDVMCMNEPLNINNVADNNIDKFIPCRQSIHVQHVL